MRTRKAKAADARQTSEKDSFRRSEMEFGVAADVYRSDVSNRASRNGAVLITVIIAIVVTACVLGLWYALCGSVGLAGILVAVLLGLVVLSSLHVAMDWERVVVMRNGKYHRLAGPGIFFTIPIFEFCTLRIDQRMNVTAFGAEETLTSDLVPVDVDAVLFWVVFDPEKACMEVEDYRFAVTLSAQTALRDAIGRASLSNVVMRRHQLDRELRDAIDDKVGDWGISVVSVEVRDMVIPKELQGALSIEAQAEARKSARIALMESEREISDILGEVAKAYDHDGIAYDLRKMHLTYEGMHDKGSSLVVPSSYTEGFTGDGEGHKAEEEDVPEHKAEPEKQR